MWEAGGKLFLREWKLFSPMTRRKKKRERMPWNQQTTNLVTECTLYAHFAAEDYHSI
jgi:hypothetical protein